MKQSQEYYKQYLEDYADNFLKQKLLKQGKGEKMSQSMSCMLENQQKERISKLPQ